LLAVGLHTCTAVARSLCVSWAFLCNTGHRKFGGLFHKKKLGPKTCKIWGDFQIQTSIASISGMDADIQSRKTNVSTAIPPAFGEKNVRGTLSH